MRSCAARALHLTAHAAPPVAKMSKALFEQLGLKEGDQVLVRQGGGEAVVAAAIDDKVPANCVRLAAGRPETASLGAASAELVAERVPAAPQKATG